MGKKILIKNTYKCEIHDFLHYRLALIDCSAQLSHPLMTTLINVVRNGQAVTSKVLNMFADNLYKATTLKSRRLAFNMLEKARQNQDLSDDIFVKLELVRAGLGLCRLEENEKKNLIQLLKEQTERGLKLPIDTMNALKVEIGANKMDTSILDILVNASRNGQLLSYELLDKLIVKFDPTESDEKTRRIIIIFQNVAKNNQSIDKRILMKLEQSLDNESLNNEVLSMFVYMAQKVFI